MYENARVQKIALLYLTMSVAESVIHIGQFESRTIDTDHADGCVYLIPPPFAIRCVKVRRLNYTP